MYRGIPQPPTTACKHCNGTGRIGQASPPGSYSCTSCNGTGVTGYPAYGCILLLIYFVTVALVLGYFIMKG